MAFWGPGLGEWRIQRSLKECPCNIVRMRNAGSAGYSIGEYRILCCTVLRILYYAVLYYTKLSAL